MVWEHKICVVVMATLLEEGGKNKCDKYFPYANETVEYAGIKIAHVRQQQCRGYLKSFVTLTKDGPCRATLRSCR